MRREKFTTRIGATDITLHNADQMVRAFFDDRPTVLVCGHYGNFEVSAYVLGILGFPSYTIARPLDNPYLDRFLNDFRGLTGQYILSKTGSSKQVEAVLAGGGILALLGDQYAGPKGCWVDFFGTPGVKPQGNRAVHPGCRSADHICLYSPHGQADASRDGHGRRVGSSEDFA